MLLGIPFHTALIFGTLGAWLISDPVSSPSLTFMASLLHIFRMPGFFVIAGFFAAMLIARRGRTPWLHDRAIRLGIPFLTAALVLNPIQLWIEAASHPHEPGMLQSMGAILTLHPDRLLSHLWFLPALLLQCIFLAMVWHLIRPHLTSISTLAERFFQSPFALLALAGAIAVWQVGEEFVRVRSAWNEMAFISPFFDAITLLPWFMLGVSARIAPALLERLTKARYDAYALAIIATPLHMAVFLHPNFPHSYFWQIVSEPMAAIGLLVCLLSLLRRYADQNNATVSAIVSASFTIYLFHHPMILLLEYALMTIAMPPIVKWALIVSITLPACFAIHRVLARSATAMFLFNGVMKKGGRSILRRAESR